MQLFGPGKHRGLGAPLQLWAGSRYRLVAQVHQYSYNPSGGPKPVLGSYEPNVQAGKNSGTDRAVATWVYVSWSPMPRKKYKQKAEIQAKFRTFFLVA